MKKGLLLLGGILSLFTLASCGGNATAEQRAVNQDLADRIAKISDTGKEIDVKDKHVYLYSLTDNKIFLGNGIGWVKERELTNITRLVQYNNYFEVYIGNTKYTFSNNVAGYIIC